jgi:hypothetical protein
VIKPVFERQELASASIQLNQERSIRGYRGDFPRTRTACSEAASGNLKTSSISGLLRLEVSGFRVTKRGE